jgi:hypothetical protein
MPVYADAWRQRCARSSFATTHTGGNGNRSLESGRDAESGDSGSANSGTAATNAEPNSGTRSIAKPDAEWQSNADAEPHAKRQSDSAAGANGNPKPDAESESKPESCTSAR